MSFVQNQASFRAGTENELPSLAGILSALSYALDLTEGQRPGHSLRAAWIATQIAMELPIADADRRTVYYATMLKDLGCSSNAAQIAQLYQTDDRSFKHDSRLIEVGPGARLRFVLCRTAADRPLPRRALAIANVLGNDTRITRSLIETRCDAGARIARRLRFSEDVAGAIRALDEHWDGSGQPLGMVGEAIPLGARIALLCQIADVFFAHGGPKAAREAVAGLRGLWLDPRLCDVFAALSAHPAFWHDLASEYMVRELLRLEPPGESLVVDESYLDEIAAAFGEVIDAKSPYTAGHSGRVGANADAIARRLGIAMTERPLLRRAAMLHDVGKLAISSTVLEKPGRLDEEEWRAVRDHAAQTTEILSRVRPLCAMAMVAGSHHERLDGKGYPFGLDSAILAQETRIITVCDIFDALTSERPWRGAMSVEQALDLMAQEVGAAIDGGCFEALRQEVETGAAAIPAGVGAGTGLLAAERL